MNDEYPVPAPDPAARDEPAEASFPWPAAEGESLANAFGRTWQGAALQPRRFYAGIPERGGVGPALLFYLPIGIVVAGVNLFWTTVLGAAFAGNPVYADVMGGGLSPVVEFLLSPLLLLLALYLTAGVVHVLLMLFGGTHRAFAVTVQVFAYAYAPAVVAVVPMLGQVAGLVWMVVVSIIGLAAAQRTSTGRSAAAVLLPVGCLFILLVAFALLAAAGALLVA